MVTFYLVLAVLTGLAIMALFPRADLMPISAAAEEPVIAQLHIRRYLPELPTCSIQVTLGALGNYMVYFVTPERRKVCLASERSDAFPDCESCLRAWQPAVTKYGRLFQKCQGVSA